MTKALVVAQREVRTFLRDRGDLAFSLLLPIAIFALMYGAFGSGAEFHGTAHIVNQDEEGAYSALLLEELDEAENVDVDLLTPEQADSKLDRSDLLMVVNIPQDFSSKLAEGGLIDVHFRLSDLYKTL